MLPDIRPGNTKILYFFNCLLDGMHTSFIYLLEFCRWQLGKSVRGSFEEDDRRYKNSRKSKLIGLTLKRLS